MKFNQQIVLTDGFEQEILETPVDNSHTVRDVLGTTVHIGKQDIIAIIAKEVIAHINIKLVQE